MIKKIKLLFKLKFVQNSIWLFILQIFNTIIPFLTLPYITRVLGAEKYGVFSLAVNWILYFQVLVEYGFGYTGSRRVSLDDGKSKQQIFSEILTSRLILTGLSFALLNIVSLLLHASIEQYYSMIILFVMILGIAFQMTWLFQGMQDMKMITIINASSRIVSVVLVFLLVHKPEDLYLYCFCYSATFVLSAVLGIFYSIRKYSLKLKLCSMKDASLAIKDGWYIFISQAMSKIFSGIGLTVLGQVSSKTIVGIYSALYKIPYVMVLFFSPISQAIYPYISKAYANSFEDGIKQLKKIGKYVITSFVVIMFLIMLFRKQITDIVFGVEYGLFSDIIIPLSIWFIISITNNFLGIQVLVACGEQKRYSKCFFFGALSTIAFNILFGNIWGIYGISIAAPLGEFLLFLLLFINVLHYKNIIHSAER